MLNSAKPSGIASTSTGFPLISSEGWEEHTVKCLGNPEKGEKVPGCYPDNTPYTGDYPGWNPNGYILSKMVRAVV